MAEVGLLSPDERVEVGESTLRYDLQNKAELYAKHGIVEYWVVDLVDAKLHRFRHPSGDRYAEHEIVAAGSVRFESLNIEIPIDDLF